MVHVYGQNYRLSASYDCGNRYTSSFNIAWRGCSAASPYERNGNGGAGQRAPVPLSREAARQMAAPIAVWDHVKASST
eukprot:6214659-Pleurochrysis_carterae.AAC.3